jgi:hypothetical protein
MDKLQQDFNDKVDSLLIKRGLFPKKKSKGIINAFSLHFKAQAWWHHCIHGDGIEMLDILSDDSKLISGEQFNSNFVLPLHDLHQVDLLTNKTWDALHSSIIRFSGERIGSGEFYLPLVIQGWTFEKHGGKGDGYVAGGSREVKSGTASLKPSANAQHRVIDKLNSTVFGGHRPGPEKENTRSKGHSFDKFVTWLNSQPNKEQVLLTYFTQLYPEQNVVGMCHHLAAATTFKEFTNIIGREVLAWYKEADKWDSLVIINEKKMIIANICDVTDLENFKDLQFKWSFYRGGDVRQHADGYVNISI